MSSVTNETIASRNKRKRQGDEDSTSRTTDTDTAVRNAIIGLEFPDGRVLYCPQSTLVNAGGYFAACFGDDGIPAGAVRNDEHGRPIHFVTGDGELFAKYILPFILRRDTALLPPFSKDPVLWRKLRQESQYYALDELSQIRFMSHIHVHMPLATKTAAYYIG